MPALSAYPRPSPVLRAHANHVHSVDGPSVITPLDAPEAAEFASDYVANRAPVSVVVGPANTHRVELETLAFYNRDSVAVFAPSPVS